MSSTFTWIFILAAVVIGIGFLTTLGMSGFLFFNVFRTAKRITDQLESDEPPESRSRRSARDLIGQLPPGDAAYKCRNCGATVDSTAELTPDGRFRCNYCNQTSSIFQ
jgi:DNA-directed RNA polymerase subunit RPC12/RpoP